VSGFTANAGGRCYCVGVAGACNAHLAYRHSATVLQGGACPQGSNQDLWLLELATSLAGERFGHSMRKAWVQMHQRMTCLCVMGVNDVMVSEQVHV